LASRVASVARFEHNGASLIDEALGEPTSGHLVFLHGWGQHRESLRGIATLFQHTHCVHLLDLPGFGEAPIPPPEWDTIHYTDLVQQWLLDRLTGPVVLVGHSFGGKVAVRLAARHLPHVRGLVLIGVPGLPQPWWSHARIRRWGIRMLRRALRAAEPLVGSGAVEWHTKRFGSRDYLTAGALRPVFVRIVNEDLTESARLIAVPTLLLWGTDDREAPPWLAERYGALIGGRATLELLPHKDHHPQLGTGAHLCGAKIRCWLSTAVDV
jgi:pimeloyl-ACP methyl ester carboxylesterase